MSNYYEKCMQEIIRLMEDHQYDKASQKIDEELNMPYIPKDFEEKLKELKMQLLTFESEMKLSDEQIEAYIDMDERHQLLAVKALSESNMRRYSDLIQKGLDHSESIFVKISLIEACIDQELSEEFHVEKEGLEISFVPKLCVKPHQSRAVLKTAALMEKWLENEDPSFLNLCIQCMLKEAYLHLPLEIDEDESEALAYEIVMAVSDMMGCQKEMKTLLSKKNASQKGGFELLLYSNTI